MILVTGADGFVGSALCAQLARKELAFRAAVRGMPSKKADWLRSVDTYTIGSLGAQTDWEEAMDGVATVVHLAARTHILHETASDSLSAYREVNVVATQRLARIAAASGARRFIFISSVKVNGERTRDRPFSEDSVPVPEDAYGISKWEAEQALAEITREAGLKLTVLRAPLVYGPGVKANFLRLMHWVARGTPLPLATVRNCRSLIYLGNLVDAIVTCIEVPAAANRTYLVSDGEDVSTPDLIRALAAALGVPARLFPCPTAALKLAGALLGKGAEIARLTDSLQVDSSRIRRELGWRPPFHLTEGLAHTVRWYTDTHKRST